MEAAELNLEKGILGRRGSKCGGPEVGMNLISLRNKMLRVWSMLRGQKCGGIGRQGFADHAGPCSQCKELNFI